MDAVACRSNKRNRILSAAYGLFKRGGFSATGVDRIIADAEVAKMTMYRHFPSKEILIVEVLNRRAERFREQMTDRLDPALPPRAQISAVLDWYENWFGDADFHGCLFAHALAEFHRRDSPIFAAVARQKADLMECLAGVVAPWMSPSRAQDVAMSLMMLIEGATLMAQLGHGDAAIGSVRQSAAAILAAAEVLP